MMPFHKILFPVDFSAASEAMAPYVQETAVRCSAQVTVMHSFDLVRGYNLAGHFNAACETERLPIPYGPSMAKLRREEEEHLQTLIREQFPHVECSMIMEDGDPADVIQGVAHRGRMDLIMMPTRGIGTFRRVLLGSTTAKVLHDVDCPVLTSVHELDPAAPHHADLRVIVCAVEVNDQAETILKTAGLVAQAWGARLSIVHMIGSYLKMLRTSSPDLDIGALMRKCGVTGSIRALHEDVVEGIRRTAVEESADLVIVGRGHDRGALSRLWSDLYEIVRESPCPVLSV